jgi:uncharacterized protein
MTNDKIILGTVQFGLHYGINNLAGKPSEKEVFNILDIAHDNGIDCLDTADAYGDSIALIGKYHKSRSFRFKVLSKFKNIKRDDLKDNVIKSLKEINISDFEVYSYHSFNEYENNQDLMDILIELKSKGIVTKIGISVYTNSELEQTILDSRIDVIQLPYNILDNINLRGSLIERAKSSGKEVHTRSVFLQGLFFVDSERYPEKLIPLKPYIQEIKDFCKAESVSMQSVALSYVLANKNIDRVLIGVDTSSQLLSNIESIKNHQKAFEFIDNFVVVKETELLNPVNWA